MIHYSKLPLSRYYDSITLTGLACTASDIRKIMDLFSGERVGLSLIALEEDSPMITWLEGQRWDLQIDRLHGNVTVNVPWERLPMALEKAAAETPEVMVLFLPPLSPAGEIGEEWEGKMKEGDLDVYLCASPDENTLMLAVRKGLFPSKELFRWVKSLKFT